MNDPLWYKDAILYQLHVKSFFDSTDDGVGDFAGLTQKLDYVQSLGVTALWILPFYPSPLRDDGYDIADYRNVNPSFGTMRDFRNFVREAHKRGLRVITELVINHTSDEHPWFQRARKARKGSSARNFYVWSDSDEKYAGTRIIFTDTEASNWSWDPIAEAYYWHRFFSHQPDLNFDNPRVVEAVIQTMFYWLDMGVDGLRLDAIPYLFEREGTNNENLPETHEVVRKIRAALDARFPDRMLLAEANQWPEDVRPYFGEGDECHMAFHFPLMPRMYMALAQEDRHPVTDIMRQTPEIPSNCQWAIFLRNHDELTLEMVTDRERDYLWRFYAADSRAKLNLGIRRRLAPLLDNDRRKIELLNALLMSMPGTPIVYYGDEIGMGDNLYLGDRNGVRTPMQWSPDRNAGFSRADPAKLFLPAIMDPVYGYDAVNAEAQGRNSSSLLNWMRRLIAVRRNFKAFGRGTISFLYPSNRKVMVYLREFEGETILCIVNFSRAPQAAELDLSAYRDRVPVELLGQSPFPPIGKLPYFITLPGYGFYWFQLTTEAKAPDWHETLAAPVPELITLVVPRGWSSLAAGEPWNVLMGRVLPAFLPGQRWFGAKDSHIRAVKPYAASQLGDGSAGWMMLVCEVSLGGRRTALYNVPLSIAWESASEDPLLDLLPFTLARVRQGPRLGILYDAFADEGFMRHVIAQMGENAEIAAGDGRVVFTATPAFTAPAPDAPVRRLGVEQSNSSALIGETMVAKIYRRLESGVHPEIEMGRYLSEHAGYANTPRVMGTIELSGANGEITALGVAHEFVRNQGDGWRYTLDYLGRFHEDADLVAADPQEGTDTRHPTYLHFARILGTRTAELHRALARTTDQEAFRPEAVTDADLARWKGRIAERASRALQALQTAQRRATGDLRARIDAVLAQRHKIEGLADALGIARPDWLKSRIHGDLHLGQVLVVKDDVYVIDLEGEPVVALRHRRAKDSPLRDVAGVVRSFDYAAWAAVLARSEGRAEMPEHLLSLTLDWAAEMKAAFLDAYFEAVGDCATVPCPREAADNLLRLLTLDKAFYEVGYEAANRPTWLRVPVEGVLSLLETEGAT